MKNSFSIIRAGIFAFLMIIMCQSLASAQTTADTLPSYCQAIAELHQNQRLIAGWPGVSEREFDSLPITQIATDPTPQLSKEEVSIAYVGHSTFRIETPGGLTIATDYSGFAGKDVIPDVITMNHAHATHFTVAPDPRIKHVLRGWGSGVPAKHHLSIDDAVIRNVTTDINNQWAGYEPDGNSIFIFEVAGLCIGHLGHLHHALNDVHYAEIGRLDILMVPVDDGMTLNLKDMVAIVERLRASTILPMHWFGPWSLQQFIENLNSEFPVDHSGKSSLTASVRSLPSLPTVVVLQPENGFELDFGDD